ncbi:tyrosine-type recombinase/integrase [Brevibacillus laterosporus]|uniref:tyrosine-type recombinase/integrase n=1 Tax=Brevibacillus laterosporus TaxID=1465 RepID=UPI000E6D5692|nr:tyrosine-type recombinase/integrase [Brevibacillus laterosporus]AYB37520.1 site-specific integrase [Brevibacillus laterosporus]MBM7110948.1 Tyrosine recombinase XerC [Brevibacillus laterosporus]
MTDKKRGRVYNRIFDENEWLEVNEENKNIVEDFLEEYRQRKIKPSTISQYKNDLRIVLLYIKRKLKNRSLLELTKKDFRRFSLWLSEELKVSNARANRLMSAVRSLLTFVEDDDDYDYNNNVAKKVKGLPKEAVKTNEDDFFLTYTQVTKLRDELIKRNRLQHATLLMVMFDSAGRRNEVTQVQKHGLLAGNKTNVVIGKRGKSFPLVYLDDTKELIRCYLNERGEDNIDSLWISGKGENKRAATYESLYERVVYMSKVLSEIEGAKIEFFPHSLRHSRCECLLQGEDPRLLDEHGKPKKFSLEEVQKFMHHSDPKTTQDYSKNHDEDVIDDMFGFK